MKLYFRNSHGKLRVIAEPTNEKECLAAINQFLEEHDFKSYYTRVWINPDTKRKIYDVGSHTEFFEMELSDEEYENDELNQIDTYLKDVGM